MPLRKSKGNMYEFCTHTWNPIFGQCIHKCGYCYMRQSTWTLPELHFREKEMHTPLGSGRTIFVGSATDMWAHDVPAEWINKVLWRCKQSDNTYLFQSKNPHRFAIHDMPKNTILGTTIETNRHYKDSAAPTVYERATAMWSLKDMRRTVTIEPIMDFDLYTMLQLVRDCEPEFVSIGADSKGHNLQEPTWFKAQELIMHLKKFTEVKVKHNLERLEKPRRVF